VFVSLYVVLGKPRRAFLQTRDGLKRLRAGAEDCVAQGRLRPRERKVAQSAGRAVLIGEIDAEGRNAAAAAELEIKHCVGERPTRDRWIGRVCLIKSIDEPRETEGRRPPLYLQRAGRVFKRIAA
jgi:hypothetical protein